MAATDVLGPAAEFAVETPAEAEIDVPAGWQRRRDAHAPAAPTCKSLRKCSPG